MSLNATIEEMIHIHLRDNNPQWYNMTKNNVLQIHHHCLEFEEEADDWNICWDEAIINSCECITLESRKNDKENIWYWNPCGEAKFRVKIIGFKDAEEEEEWQRATYEKLKDVAEDLW